MSGFRLPTRSFAVYHPARSILVATAITIAAIAGLMADNEPAKPPSSAGVHAISDHPSPAPEGS